MLPNRLKDRRLQHALLEKMSSGPAHVTVCICTYRRPHLLRRLLQALAHQVTGGLFSYSIVVTDNDGAQSAEPVVSEFRLASGMDITYCSEPRQNIALARNKALASATGDLIAFIDDDEFPEADWLQTLFRAITANTVDGVLGPVEPHFDQEPPAWVVRGKFYNRPRHKTGFIIPWTEGRTGNVLFKREILEGIGEPFRAEFGSGGEDRDFFRRLIERRRVFMWCDEAVAYEVVPPVRCRRGFMLKRALLRGKMSLRRKGCGLRGVLTSVVAVPVYSMALPFLLLLGHHQFMKYLVKVFDHAGRVLAFIGLDPVREAYVTE